MIELPLHTAWLQEAMQFAGMAERQPDVAIRLRTNLESSAQRCRDVLAVNPHNDIAKRTLSRIENLLRKNGEKPQQLPQQNAFITSLNKEFVLQKTAQYFKIAPEDLLPQNESEREYQEELEFFEQKFLEYGATTLLPALEQLSDNIPEEQGLKTALSTPFEVVQRNTMNPLRNIEVVNRIANKLQVRDIEILFKMPNPLFFSYGPMSEDCGGVAAYSPVWRTISFSEKTDFSNEMDQLNFLHELIHVIQAAPQRKRGQAFVDFYGQVKRVIVNEEFEAYAVVSEALNLRMKNSLKSKRQRGEPITVGEVYDFLNCTTDQFSVADGWACSAGQYFPNGNFLKNEYPQEYSDGIRNVQFEDGFEVFEVRDNQLVQLRRVLKTNE